LTASKTNRASAYTRTSSSGHKDSFSLSLYRFFFFSSVFSVLGVCVCLFFFFAVDRFVKLLVLVFFCFTMVEFVGLLSFVDA
jgi:hypothetical protein